jgi:Tol biopolymer transport system component
MVRNYTWYYMEVYAQYPAWGRKGNNLYYTCDPSGVFETIEICAIDLATSQTTQVTHLNDTLDILNITDLDVSMDGQIIFVLRLEGLDAPIDIYRYDLATGELINLTADIDVDVYAPRWVESPPAAP